MRLTEFLDSRLMKMTRLLALRTDHLYHNSYESTPVNPSRTEPATQLLVAQCHRVPPSHVKLLSCAPDFNHKRVSRCKQQTRAIKYKHNYGFTQLKEYRAKNISKHVHIELQQVA